MLRNIFGGKFIERYRPFFGKHAACRALQRAHVTLGAERYRQIACKRTDIRASPANDFKRVFVGRGLPRAFEGENAHLFCLQIKIRTRAR